MDLSELFHCTIPDFTLITNSDTFMPVELTNSSSCYLPDPQTKYNQHPMCCQHQKEEKGMVTTAAAKEKNNSTHWKEQTKNQNHQKKHQKKHHKEA